MIKFYIFGENVYKFIKIIKSLHMLRYFYFLIVLNHFLNMIIHKCYQMNLLQNYYIC
jgi:hypothetical protein